MIQVRDTSRFAVHSCGSSPLEFGIDHQTSFYALYPCSNPASSRIQSNISQAAPHTASGHYLVFASCSESSATLSQRPRNPFSISDIVAFIQFLFIRSVHITWQTKTHENGLPNYISHCLTCSSHHHPNSQSPPPRNPDLANSSNLPRSDTHIEFHFFMI